MRSTSKCALLLMALACGAQLHAQTQYSGAIYGHVYCADTNAPARFARVVLIPVQTGNGTENRNFGQGSGVTGLDGSFQIQNMAPGAYYITAMMPGYLNPILQIAQADLMSSDPAVQERIAKTLTTISVHGSDGAHVEIRLERGASLSGTIYYDDGSPAVNVQVNARPAVNNQGSDVTQPINSPFLQSPARTDDYGRYRVSGLPPGDYVVMASSQMQFGGFNGPRRNPQSSTLTIYAPKSFNSADAKVFTLNAGSELTGADILIPVAAFHTVSGSVESSDGHTLNAGSLTLTDDKDKTHSFRSSVGNNGQFRFLYVPEGSYTLSLSGAAITEPSTTGGNNRGRPQTTVVQAYGNATQSVLVENGDLSVAVQAPPVTQSQTQNSTSPAP